MTLTLSFGPWSISHATPTGADATGSTCYSLIEKSCSDTAYQWDWKGQSLAGVSNCTYLFEDLQTRKSITWSNTASQSSWYNVSSTGGEQGQEAPVYVPVELTATFCWEPDEINQSTPGLPPPNDRMLAKALDGTSIGI